MKESHVQKKVSEFAQALGWEVRPWKSMNNNFVPDRIYFRHTVIIIIEFKRPGGKASAGQIEEHKILKHHQLNFYLVDTIGQGKKIFQSRELEK